MSNVELSKQKLDIDQAARHLQLQIHKMQHDLKILLRGIEALDNGEKMLTDTSILAGEARNKSKIINHIFQRFIK